MRVWYGYGKPVQISIVRILIAGYPAGGLSSCLTCHLVNMGSSLPLSDGRCPSCLTVISQ